MTTSLVGGRLLGARAVVCIAVALGYRRGRLGARQSSQPRTVETTGVGVARCVDGVLVQSCARSVPGVGLFLNGRRKRAVRRAEILSMISKPTGAEHTARQYPDQVDHEQHARLLQQFASIRNSLSALPSPGRGRELRTVGSSSRLGRRHPGAIGCDMTSSRSWSAGGHALQRVRSARRGYWAARDRCDRRDVEQACREWVEALIAAAETALEPRCCDVNQRRY
jgi:hypothetical protein